MNQFVIRHPTFQVNHLKSRKQANTIFNTKRSIQTFPNDCSIQIVFGPSKFIPHIAKILQATFVNHIEYNHPIFHRTKCWNPQHKAKGVNIEFGVLSKHSKIQDALKFRGSIDTCEAPSIILIIVYDCIMKFGDEFTTQRSKSCFQKRAKLPPQVTLETPQKFFKFKVSHKPLGLASSNHVLAKNTTVGSLFGFNHQALELSVGSQAHNSSNMVYSLLSAGLGNSLHRCMRRKANIWKNHQFFVR